ncbi:MAG TPA: hypothetical protein VLJ76_09890 [Gaiellaceae bacterium]|nr:hypothetical protein [Gaiellaceae bacterium]
MSNFEERLLHELRNAVEQQPVDRGRRRPLRRPRLALAGGLAAGLAVAAGAGVFLLSGGTQAAYAVTKHADGTITVEIDSLSDASGLEAKLKAAGVSAVVQYLPVGKACQKPWFTPAGADAAGAMRGSVSGPASGGGTRFTISGSFPADDTLVISTQTGPGREQALGIGWAKGVVPPCQIVDAPAGSGPLGGPPTDSSQTGQG